MDIVSTEAMLQGAKHQQWKCLNPFPPFEAILWWDVIFFTTEQKRHNFLVGMTTLPQ
jgi:hypothetical protein